MKPARTRYPPRFGTRTNNRIDIDGKERSILFQNASPAQIMHETVFVIITQNHRGTMRTFFFIIAEEREHALRILFREKEREKEKNTRARI